MSKKKVMKTNPSRRTFLKGAAALSAPLILPKSVFGANEKINLAWVGLNNQGWADLRTTCHGNNVVALCDCDKGILDERENSFQEAKRYNDFRVMMEEMGDKIDAVGVGTPDHTHFGITYAAMNMGKHVFVEKPLAHSLWEIRTLQELAKKKNLMTQMGNQGHGSEGARLVKEWYEAGLIGEVKEVITWTNRPEHGWGFRGKEQMAYPKPEQIPAGFDWNAWLGPVSKDIGFSRQFHPASWRAWWDFGCGGLGDIGCHTIDTAYWALDLGNPDRIDVEMKGAANPIHTPNGSVVTFKFPARGKQPPVDVKWYEGPSRPEKPEGFDGSMRGEGGLIMVGTKGGIYHNGMRPDSPMLYPQAKWDEYKNNPEKRVPKTLPRTRGIHREWISGIKTGKKCCSDFSYSGPLAEVIVLGTLAIRTGKGVEWDARKMKIKGNPEANDLIEVPAREGWRIRDLT